MSDPNLRQNSISAVELFGQERPVARDWWDWLSKGIGSSIDGVDMISKTVVGCRKAVLSIVYTVHSILQHMECCLSLSDEHLKRWQHNFNSIIALVFIFYDIVDSQSSVSYFRSQRQRII